MKVSHKKINFQDRRGKIIDIFVNNPKDHATLITCTKGAVRGNHFHKKSTQYMFIVSGKFTAYTRQPGRSKVFKHKLLPNDLIEHRPMEEHAIVADKAGAFLAFADGLRGGKNYDKDTFRVKKPLV